ncbi:hypothetical protein SAMN06893096_103133 [Geodermatophilus pulveris]|uniref:Uncharacterized protein n=1 Tax=Geodermatophilus pulveris TaxID=1564159 RepID=A0A239DEQ2_9ACTN|nr:hypothetical protein SAMN06893096_103133 [Geodermatophilus pulveris]
MALAEELRAAGLDLDLCDAEPGSLTLSPGVAVAAGDDAVPERLTVEAGAHLHRAEATRNAVRAGPWTPGPLGVA